MKRCRYRVGDKVKVTMAGGMGPDRIYVGYIIRIDAEGNLWKREEPRYSIKTDDGKVLGNICQSCIDLV